jgi:hypothetical protein
MTRSSLLLALLLLLALRVPKHKAYAQTPSPSKDSTFHLDPEAPVTKAAPGAEQLRPRLGVNIHFVQDDRALDLAASAGFSFVRTDLVWARVEKQGRYDFTPFDCLMRSLEARGLGALWILDYGHPEHGAKQPRSKSDVSAFARFAAIAVSHFREHNARFEVWNEPNGKQFLPNPSIYPALLRTALDSIRREDPAAIVGTGGTSGLDLPFLKQVLASGSANEASAIAVHPYRPSPPESAITDITGLQTLIRRTLSSHPPVWNTEWGYSSYGSFPETFPGGGHSNAARTRQAVFAVRELLTTWMLGLPVVVWYDLRDDGPDPFNREHNFGLLNQDNSDKPAMRAVRALTTAAQGRRYTGTLSGLPAGLHAMRLDGSNDRVFVLWNDRSGTSAKIDFPRTRMLTLTDLHGTPVPADRAELTLDEAAGPVYLRFKLSS